MTGFCKNVIFRISSKSNFWAKSAIFREIEIPRIPSHYVGFVCVAFHGIISNGTPGSTGCLLSFYPKRSTRPNWASTYLAVGLVPYKIALGARGSIWNFSMKGSTPKTYVMRRFSGRISNGIFLFEGFSWPVFSVNSWTATKSAFFWTLKSNLKSCIMQFGCSFLLREFMNFLNTSCDHLRH